MLVLTRKSGQKLIINDNITLTVIEVEGARVKIGLEAPRHIRLLRAELASQADEPLIVWSSSEEAAPPTTSR